MSFPKTELLHLIPACLGAAEPRRTVLLAVALAATLLLARLSPVRPTLCTIAVACVWTTGLIVYGVLRG